MYMKIRMLLLTLLLTGTAEAQGYRDGNVAIYEAMRPMLEGSNYVPPQRIIIQHDYNTYSGGVQPLVVPNYNAYVQSPSFSEEVRKINENLEKELSALGKLSEGR
jgi:hypothetical protein